MITYSFYPTDPRLSDYIFSYGIMEIDGDYNQLVSVPNGYANFLITIKQDHADLKTTGINNIPIEHLNAFVIGQTTRPISGHMYGMLKYLIVFFEPLGLYQLFGCKMSDLTDKSENIFDFLGQEAAQSLIDKLLADDAIESQVAVLNDFFLQKAPIFNDCLMLKKALKLIHAANGNISVKALEAACKINCRSLERYFKHKIGLTPKAYAQLYRFKYAMNYLKQNPQITWAELSSNSHYFDQAHMIRHFKKYVHVTPENLVTLDIDFINYFLHLWTPVVFVQYNGVNGSYFCVRFKLLHQL